MAAATGPSGPLALVASAAGIFVVNLVLQPATLLTALGRKAASIPFLASESDPGVPPLLTPPIGTALVCFPARHPRQLWRRVLTDQRDRVCACPSPKNSSPLEQQTATTSLQAWASALHERDAAERECLQRLLDPTVTPNAATFDQTFFAHLHAAGITVTAAGWPAIERGLPRPEVPASTNDDAGTSDDREGAGAKPRHTAHGKRAQRRKSNTVSSLGGSPYPQSPAASGTPKTCWCIDAPGHRPAHECHVGARLWLGASPSQRAPPSPFTLFSRSSAVH